MQATTHAILLIVLALTALLSVLALKRRVPTSRQFVVAFALASLGAIAAAGFGAHLCYEGRPRNQILILGPCLLLTLTLIQSATWRRIFGAGLFIGMVGLSFHFAGLVHAPGWTGNPAFDGGQQALYRSLHSKAVAVASDIGNPDVALPEGWLRDLPIGVDLRPIFENQHPPPTPNPARLAFAAHGPLSVYSDPTRLLVPRRAAEGRRRQDRTAQPSLATMQHSTSSNGFPMCVTATPSLRTARDRRNANFV